MPPPGARWPASPSRSPSAPGPRRHRRFLALTAAGGPAACASSTSAAARSGCAAWRPSSTSPASTSPTAPPTRARSCRPTPRGACPSTTAPSTSPTPPASSSTCAPADRAAFAAEVRRVARGWWVQTPAWSFPIEPHALLPFAHWLPVGLRRRYWRLGAAGGWEEIALLRRGELAALLPGSTLLAERFGPLAKSWIAFAPGAVTLGPRPQRSDRARLRGARAERRLPAGTLGYFAGGANDERALRDNVAAYARRRLRPRVLVDVDAVSTETTILGTPVSMPLLVAPMALQRMAHPDGEPATARGAAAAGTIFTLSTLASSRPSEVAEHAPADRAALVSDVRAARPRRHAGAVRRRARARLRRRGADRRRAAARAAASATSARASACPPTSTSPPSARCWERSVPDRPGVLRRSSTARSRWDTVAELAEELEVPLVLKGIQTAEDAELACEHGARRDRRLQPRRAPARCAWAPTLDLLPEVVDAVGGQIEVLRRRRGPPRHRRARRARARRASGARGPARAVGAGRRRRGGGRRVCWGCCVTRSSWGSACWGRRRRRT